MLHYQLKMTLQRQGTRPHALTIELLGIDSPFKALPVIQESRLFTIRSEISTTRIYLFLRLQCQLLHSPYKHNSLLSIKHRLITSIFFSSVPLLLLLEEISIQRNET